VIWVGLILYLAVGYWLAAKVGGLGRLSDAQRLTLMVLWPAVMVVAVAKMIWGTASASEGQYDDDDDEDEYEGSDTDSHGRDPTPWPPPSNP